MSRIAIIFPSIQVPAAYVKRIDAGLSASQQNLADKSSITARQSQIESQYKQLLNQGRTRQDKLNEACKAYVLVREAADLANWIKDKEQYAQVQVRNNFYQSGVNAGNIFRLIYTFYR